MTYAKGIEGTFLNAVMPQAEQIEEMQQPGPDGPVVMVNLLKFKEKAEYPDGRETDLTGRAAYDIYARSVVEILHTFGGRIVFAGDVSFLALGACDPMWDEVALAWYPSRKNLFEMSTSEAWMKIAIHRAAGLAGQLNIETTPNFLAPGVIAGADEIQPIEGS